MRTLVYHAPFHPDQEYIGYMLLDMHRVIGSDFMLPIFKKHGLLNIDPNRWYSVLPYFAAINELMVLGGARTDLLYMGIKQVEDMVAYDDIVLRPINERLLLLNDVYYMHTRGTNVGEIYGEVISNRHVKLHLLVPQPDDVWYGICYGYMKRFAKEVNFTVKYDDSVVRRDEGGEVTVIDVTWQ